MVKTHKTKTNEDQIDNLPGKEFRVMIVKMIQNLKNKMEACVNRPEAWIQKTQEMFARDLEALSNKQLIMNNKIIEIKN